MLSHDITEFYKILNVYGALVPIYHCQGKFSIVTREHQGEGEYVLRHIREWVQRKKVVLKESRIRKCVICRIQIDNRNFPATITRREHINETIRVSKLSTSTLVQTKQSQGWSLNSQHQLLVPAIWYQLTFAINLSRGGHYYWLP
jgi:hypothetical protein